MRLKALGNKYGLGYKHTEKAKKKISIAFLGEKNHNWKGNLVSYGCLHFWVKRRLPLPKNCEICGKNTKKLHCSNKTGKYERNISDWFYLCVSCHKKHDLKIKKQTSKTFFFDGNHFTYRLTTSLQ